VSSRAAQAPAPRRRWLAGLFTLLLGTLIVSLSLVAGATRWLPAGAGEVNHLIIPALAFPGVWVIVFLLAYAARSRKRMVIALALLGSLNALLVLRAFQG
jgi:hypothetical protein